MAQVHNLEQAEPVVAKLYNIAHLSFLELSRIMVELERRGCHNINFVSPSHFVPHIMQALPKAIEMGLTVPLVYNTGGYDSPPALELLNGVVDIYMPDMKYADADTARRYSHVSDYPQVNQAAVREMHRQVGDLVLDERGLAVRGLLVRHLVLPGGLAGTREILGFLGREISRKTYLNIMGQYRPCYRAEEIEPLARRISRAEWNEALALADSYGFTRLDERSTPMALRQVPP